MSLCGEQSSQDTVIIVWTTVQHQLCQEERHNKRRKKEIIRKSRGFVSQCQCYVFQYLDTSSGLRDSVDIVVAGKLTEIRQTPTQIVLCCQQLCRYCTLYI